MYNSALSKHGSNFIVISLLLLPIFLSLCFSSQIASQSHKLTFPSGSNARARLSGVLPADLEEFTVCFWVKVHQISSSRSTILYYSVSEDGNEFRFFYDRNSFGFIRKSAIARTRAGLVSLGEWYHICSIWTSWEGYWQIYVNGHLEGNGTGIATGQKICEDSNGNLRVGPDQDDGIDYGDISKDIFVGSIADVNVWDEALAEEWVVRKFHCCPIEGNVLAWNKLKVTTYGGVVVGPSYHCRRECDSIETRGDIAKK